MKKSCLGTWNEKLALFKDVARAATLSDTKWPLYLSSPHHAIITGNLTCDPLPRTVKEASPERFICEGFIQSIGAALVDPESTILNISSVDKNSKIQVSDEEVPLSIRDARLFVVALSRTPRKEQLMLTAKLVNTLASALISLNDDENLRSLLISERAYAGFVARAVTVCSTIIDMASSGKLLLESLCQYIGPLHYHLPSFIEVEDANAARQECLTDWYKRESCFMGLWPDWEMASLPSVNANAKIDPLSSDDIANYKLLLDIALELGFQTAPTDMCHLAFASWNASAKLCGIDNEVWVGPSTANDMSNRCDAAKLTSIRDDICHIYQELVNDESTTPDSYLSGQLRRKRRRNAGTSGQNRGIEFLKAGVSESIKMLADLSSAAHDRNEAASPSAECVVAEATLSYLSFLTAMFTTSGTDLLTALVRRDKNRRKRKNSSFSGDSMGDVEMDDDCSEESGESGGFGDHDFDDDEDEEEAQMDGITRLHHVCNVLGASPFHPDWLDATCRLRPGINETTSVELAEQMLRAVTDFGTEAFAQYARVLSKVISTCASDNAKSVVDGSSALAVFRGIRHVEPESGSTATDLQWQNDIAEAFNLDITIVRAIFIGLPCKNTNSVKESFSMNSAHRIRGKLQDFLASGSGWLPNASEYRAGGEWELLLSDALVGPCSVLDLSDSLDSTKSGATASDPSSDAGLLSDPALKTLCSDVLRWKRVLRSTINTMVTVNALLRFGLNGAKGRAQHRATNLENDEIGGRTASHLSYQTSPIRQHIRDRNASSANMSTTQLKDSVCKALCLLAEVQSCGFTSQIIQQSARSATCHLVGVDNDVLNLEGVHAIRNSLVGMKELSKAQGLRRQVNAHNVVDKLVESMGSSDLIADDFETKLLFCLGSPSDLKANTIVESSIDLRKMLQKCGHSEIYSDLPSWDWSASPNEEIQFLTQIIQGQHKNIVSASIRSRVIVRLRDALDAEDGKLAQLDFKPDSTVKKAILKHWSSLATSPLQALVKNDICIVGSKTSSASSDDEKTLAFEISRQLCAIIGRLLGAVTAKDSKVEKMFGTVLKVLKASMQHWVYEKELNHVMCTMCILAMRLGTVTDVGTELLHIVKKRGSAQADQDLFILELFYRFLQGKFRMHALNPSF